MIRDYISIAVGSLRKRFLRTMLTMIGIFIGIATVVALVSLGQGMQTAINAQFAGVGTDKIIIQGASAGFGPPGQNTAGSVNDNDIEMVRKITGVKRAAGRLLRSVTVEFANEAITIFAASLPEPSDDRDLVIEANSIKVAEGRMLKSSDSKKVLVGNHLWTTNHFSKPLSISSKLSINKVDFEIVGFLEKIGAGRDTSIMINEKDARELFHEDKQVSAIVAQVDPNEKPAIVADNILRAFRRDRHQKEGFEDVTVSTSEEIIASVNVILNVVQAVFIGIALISLIVGGVGIMNTMYTSVVEQTRNIGIMKAIGARNGHILLIFLLESGILGFCGGAIGVVIGMGLSKLVEIGARGIIGNVLQAVFPLPLIIGAITFSTVIGIFAGVLPASQASTLHPVEALRHD